jgi:hypothetical protein
MKTIIVSILSAMFICGAVYASNIVKDDAYQPIQGFASDPAKDIKLSVAGKIVDMSNDVAWQVTNIPSMCTYQNMSTPTITGFNKVLQSGTDGRVVFHRKHGTSFGNHSSAFTRFANCSSAVLERL